jgi:SAM-dependent methyltransferase
LKSLELEKYSPDSFEYPVVIRQMQLAKHKKDWEELAALDPLWAILSDPKKQFNRWNPEAFFLTGTDGVSELVHEARRLGRPLEWNRALDFGCGVGRLTHALRRYFTECHGVDISSEMTRRATTLAPECIFHVNAQTNLQIFQNSYFDFIYSVIVLQHQPNRDVVFEYVAEFLRVLRHGGLLVFQLPCHIPVRNRIQMRRRVYALLHALGWNSRFLYERLKLAPIRMVSIPEKEVLVFVRSRGGEILDVRPDRHAGEAIESKTYYVSR